MTIKAREFSAPTALALLGLITAAGIFLRLIGLNNDLWIDELATLKALKTSTPVQMWGTYGGANHHMLNSLLVWVSIRLFGEAEWTVRLPAVLFGACAVPVMYWVGKLARFTRGEALAGALLLALSYHHIWFSQNARGYTGYVLFSLLSTGALVQVLRTSGARWVAIFVLTGGLNFMTILPSLCVFCAQILLATAALWAGRKSESADPSRHGRVLFALGACAAIGLAIYSPLAVEIVQNLGKNAPAQVTAFPLFSLAFAQEVAHGLLPGLSPFWLMLALLPAGGAVWGAFVILRQAPVLAGVLLGAHFLFAGAILFLAWPVYPRLFILMLPFGILSAVALTGVFIRLVPAHWPIPRRLLSPAALALAVAGLALMLPELYRVPKQPYRLALKEAGRLAAPPATVIAVGVADHGIKYYGEQIPDAPFRLGYARTVKEFDDLLAQHQHDQILLISTFNRALSLESPDLWAVVQKRWRQVVTCRGSLRGGGLTIWAPVESDGSGR